MASDFDVPFIYDDHEFWSFGSKIWRKGISPVNWYSRWLWAKWERRILARAGAVVTVSNTIAEEHSKWAKDVFVVPNLPTKAEVESLPSDTQRPGKLSSAYIGRVTPPFIPYRDVTGFVDLFADGKLGDLTVIGDGQLRSTTRVSSAGLLPHQEMMFQLGKNHFGMIPWKKHWFHKYCNPNKAYEYAHCGLVVLCIDDLEPVVEALTPMCETFGDYHELVEILASYRGGVEELEDRRVRIIEFARKTLLYDRYEGVLLEAYRRAIRQG